MEGGPVGHRQVDALLRGRRGGSASLGSTRSPAHQQLEGEDAQHPEVDSEVVAFLAQHLRRQVLGGPTEGVGLLPPPQLLGEAKVNLWVPAPSASAAPTTPCPGTAAAVLVLLGHPPRYQLDVAALVQHEVLGLQVAVDDAAAVQVLETLNHAGTAEHGQRLLKAAPAPQGSVVARCHMARHCHPRSPRLHTSHAAWSTARRPGRTPAAGRRTAHPGRCRKTCRQRGVGGTSAMPAAVPPQPLPPPVPAAPALTPR